MNDDCWDVLVDKDFLSEQFFIDYADKLKKGEKNMGKILILCDGDKQNTQQILNKNGVRPGKIREIRSIETAMQMVGEGLGIGFNRESYVRGKNSYSNSYKGTLGNYAAGGEENLAATSAQNTSGSSRWFSAQVYEYNVVTYRNEGKDVVSKKVSNGSSINAEIDRDKNSKAYNYIHVGQGYASSEYSSATMLDNYTYTAKQYYE